MRPVGCLLQIKDSTFFLVLGSDNIKVNNATISTWLYDTPMCDVSGLPSVRCQQTMGHVQVQESSAKVDRNPSSSLCIIHQNPPSEQRCCCTHRVPAATVLQVETQPQRRVHPCCFFPALP